MIEVEEGWVEEKEGGRERKMGNSVVRRCVSPLSLSPSSVIGFCSSSPFGFVSTAHRRPTNLLLNSQQRPSSKFCNSLLHPRSPLRTRSLDPDGDV